MNSTPHRKGKESVRLDLKYQPSTIEGFAGLERPKAILSAFAANPYPAAFLFLGPSGIGKTTTAIALGTTIGAEIHHIRAGKCDKDTVDDLIMQCHYTPMFQAASASGIAHMPIIDEADKMSMAAQHAFLSALDTTAFPPDTVFAFTANETSNLEDRFLSRVRTINFDPEGMLAPGIELLNRIWKAEAPPDRRKSPPDFSAMLQQTGFNIRESLGLVELELLAAGSFKPKQSTTLAIASANLPGTIYTIGYQHLTPTQLGKILDHFGIQTMIDCRHQASSRLVGYSRVALESKFRDRYKWRGDILGGRGQTTDEGIDFLAKAVTQKVKLMLLCLEAAPGDCHRHTVIAQALRPRGIECQHIFGNEVVAATEVDKVIENSRYEYKSLEWRLEK